MSTIDLTSFLKSPQLPDIAAALNDCLRIESAARLVFYNQTTDDTKAEFIDGEVILHSPANNRHLLAKMNLATLLNSYVREHRLGEVRDEKCLLCLSSQ